MSSAGEITVLLRAWGHGDRSALDNLIPLVYRKLYVTARHYMAQQNPGHILQSTALVNETYLQLARIGEIHWRDRGQFFAVCAQLMRHILTDHARMQLSLKRGNGEVAVPIDEDLSIPGRDAAAELIALDDALQGLAEFDERMSQVVQLRVFGGLSVEEVGVVMKISERTVMREWKSAKLWLLRELDRSNKHAK
jgi:RNA polymerase sigma-70 factor (ECF subfamily)